MTLGSAVSGQQTFAAAGVVDTDAVRYVIEDGTAFEIGTGTYTASGTTLSRTLIESSTGALLSLTGNAVVFVTAAAQDIGGGGGTFSFCQVRNTDDTTDINSSTPANIPFGGTNDATDADYTLASTSITVNFTGTVNVQAHISQATLVERSSVGIWITKNGTKVSGVGQSGYIRRVSGHISASSHITATFTVASGDVIRVQGELRATAGVVTQLMGESQVTVNRLDGIPGTVGSPGAGVPVGGATGQVLAKINATDFNTQWIAAGSDGGKLVKYGSVSTGALATGTNTIPFDDTIPQNTEGDQYMSLVYTPLSVSNSLLIHVNWGGAHSAAASVMAPLFRNGQSDALSLGSLRGLVINELRTIAYSHFMAVPTVSPITFSVRAGSAQAGTTTFNGSTGVRRFGGVYGSSITILEFAP